MGIGRFMSEIVNAQDKSGDTALNIAARIGNRSIISQLLEVGSDAGVPNRAGLKPIDFGIGDPAEIGGRATSSPEKALQKNTRESSGDIISCKYAVPSINVVTDHHSHYLTAVRHRERICCRDGGETSHNRLNTFAASRLFSSTRRRTPKIRRHAGSNQRETRTQADDY